MIAKKVAIRGSKSSFATLANYITDDKNLSERLGLVHLTNCQSATPSAAISEVMATQHLNTRAKSDKTLHLIVSFPPGENPPESVLRDIEASLCEGLGFEEHQRMSVVHHDTDHMHMHLAINKIHPTKHTLHDPYRDYDILGQLCEQLEIKHNLTKVNHAAKRTQSQSRAKDMEQNTGLESLLSWVKDNCLDSLLSADSWEAVHKILHDHNLTMKKRGNGLVIGSQDGTHVKASSVSRDLSKPKLEKRLGVFEASKTQTQSPSRRYNKSPKGFRVDTSELYAQFQREKKQIKATRRERREGVKHKRDKAIELAKQTNKLRRSAIRLMKGNRVLKKVLYAQAYQSMARKFRSIQAEYRRELTMLSQSNRDWVWADWLKVQARLGNTEALKVLRARRGHDIKSNNTVLARGKTQSRTSASIDTVTKKGTVIFRSQGGTIRDDGQRLHVSNEAKLDAVTEALTLALSKYGHQLTLEGTPEFKAQAVHAAAKHALPITFTHAELENKRQRTMKEFHNESRRTQRQRHHRRDAGRNERVNGLRDRRNDGLRAGLRTGTSSRGHATYPPKPNVKPIGFEPPSVAKYRLRTLSSLGMVRFTRRSEMLLPSDVPSHMEQQRAEPVHPLRRDVSGAGGRGPTVRKVTIRPNSENMVSIRLN